MPISKSESKYKTEMVKSVQRFGGYARRIEDQYAVGTLDCMFVLPRCPVLFAEVKKVKDNVFGPTPRQFVEMERVAASQTGPITHAIPILIGVKDNLYYFHEIAEKVHVRDCFSVTSFDMEFADQLNLFYHGRLQK